MADDFALRGEFELAFLRLMMKAELGKLIDKEMHC